MKIWIKILIGVVIVIFVFFLYNYLVLPTCDYFTQYSEYSTNKTIKSSEEAFTELKKYLDNKLYTPEFKGTFLDYIEECKTINCMQRQNINVNDRRFNAWVLNNFLAINDDGKIYERGACI